MVEELWITRCEIDFVELENLNFVELVLECWEHPANVDLWSICIVNREKSLGVNGKCENWSVENASSEYLKNICQ